MNNYNEIIELNKFFKPYYDLTSEEENYWKTFIPNEQFYNALRITLLAIENDNLSEHSSIWMQGTYGTGKSFATAVIKNLLFKGSDEIDEFIEQFTDIQLKHKLLAYRENNKVFPIVIKGTGAIRDVATFSLEIEKSVIRSLENEGIKIKTKSDFERMIDIINHNELHSDWDKIIDSNFELKMYVSNKEELIQKLMKKDKTVLLILEKISSKNNIHFSHTNIQEWLQEVLLDLKNLSIANGIAIYWDEFTSLLEMQNSNLLLSKLQDIAELATRDNIFLYIVSHRSPEQSRLSHEDMKKVLGRFTTFEYEMETITNYHLISCAIRKLNLEQWEALRNSCSDDLREAINLISGDVGSVAKENIKDLFPIHPYSAYLSTFVSTYIGSSERSIFKFLNDKDKGFLQFINNNPCSSGEKLLTADYLFDFFYDDFKNEERQNLKSILHRFGLFEKTISSKSLKYVKVFKTILLLNILYRFVEIVDLIKPNIDNLKLIFSGTSILESIDEAIKFLKEKQIIGMNPDGMFLIETTSLPSDEVSKSIESTRNNYSSVAKVLSMEQRNKIEKSLTSTIFRSHKLRFFDISDGEYVLRSKMNKEFKPSYQLQIAVFISKDYSELDNIRHYLTEILSDDSLANVICIIPKYILDTETYESFIEYEAKANVASSRNLKDEIDINRDYAKKVIDKWLERLTTSSINWMIKYSNKQIEINENSVLMNEFSQVVNNSLMNKIYYLGLNTLKNTMNNKNIWIEKRTPKTIELFLFPDTLEDIENATNTQKLFKDTREILKDNNMNYIIHKDTLKFLRNKNIDHPLRNISNHIKEKMNNKTGMNFNLGKILNFVTKPPFGFYPNMVHYAAIAFLLKDYVGKLYEVGTGKPIDKLMMKDKIILLFDNWAGKANSNKLEVRLGSQEEKKLKDVLCDIFSLENQESLSDVRWAIRNWSKKIEYPLWVFKYKKGISKIIEKALSLLSDFLESTDETYSQELLSKTLEVVSEVEIDLKLIFKDTQIGKSLFLSRIKQIDHFEIQESEEYSLLEYIRKRSPEEHTIEWREDKVLSIAKEWYIEKLQLKKEHFPSNNTSNDEHLNFNTEEIAISNVLPSVRTIENKIDNYEGDFRAILKKMIKDYPDLSEVFKLYF
jgi:hypothetical protein